MNVRASWMARAFVGLALLGSRPAAAQVAKPREPSAGCYEISGANDAPEMTIRLTEEKIPDTGRLSELPQFEVELPPEEFDGSGTHDAYWSPGSNGAMVMVSWLFYDLESLGSLIFRAMESGASGQGIMSIVSTSGPGQPAGRTMVTVTRTACPD